MVKQPYPSYSEHLWVSLLVLFSLSHDVRKSFYFIFLKQSQSEKNLNECFCRRTCWNNPMCMCVWHRHSLHWCDAFHLFMSTSAPSNIWQRQVSSQTPHVFHILFKKKKVKVKGNSSSQKKKKRYNNKVTLISRLQLLDQNNENYVFPPIKQRCRTLHRATLLFYVTLLLFWTFEGEDIQYCSLMQQKQIRINLLSNTVNLTDDLCTASQQQPLSLYSISQISSGSRCSSGNARV